MQLSKVVCRKHVTFVSAFSPAVWEISSVCIDRWITNSKCENICEILISRYQFDGILSVWYHKFAVKVHSTASDNLSWIAILNQYCNWFGPCEYARKHMTSTDFSMSHLQSNEWQQLQTFVKMVNASFTILSQVVSCLSS